MHCSRAVCDCRASRQAGGVSSAASARYESTSSDAVRPVGRARATRGRASTTSSRSGRSLWRRLRGHVVIAPLTGPSSYASLSRGAYYSAANVSPRSPRHTGLIGEVLDCARQSRSSPWYACPADDRRIGTTASGDRSRRLSSRSPMTPCSHARTSLSRQMPLATRELRLRGGQRASLGKGMTFRARFVIAERSLWQLLFDRVDAWLNPARTPHLASATG